jgi:hypothetical protein
MHCPEKEDVSMLNVIAKHNIYKSRLNNLPRPKGNMAKQSKRILIEENKMQ